MIRNGGKEFRGVGKEGTGREGLRGDEEGREGIYSLETQCCSGY